MRLLGSAELSFHRRKTLQNTRVANVMMVTRVDMDAGNEAN
jgi:hypothetical protein